MRAGPAVVARLRVPVALGGGLMAWALSVGGGGPVHAAVQDVAEAVGDTVRARPGDRLVIRGLTGRVLVRGVEGDLVRTLARPSGPGSPVPTRSGGRIALSGRDARGRSPTRDLVVEVPRWLAVDVQADELRVSVEGLAAAVDVRTVEGDVEVREVEGSLNLWSVDGEIRVYDTRGTVSARSVDETVELQRVRGDVEVGSTDGDLNLLDVVAERIDAQTVDGDITFDGPLRPGGTYVLVTHDGDVTAAVPEGVGVRVEVSTFDGTFEADFPVTLDRFRGGRETAFTLGDGRARLVLQAFDGDIRLRRRR